VAKFLMQSVEKGPEIGIDSFEINKWLKRIWP
jgi:hypothetical protein